MGTVAFTLAMAIANYLQAALVCPEVLPDGPVDLVEFHAQQGRRYIIAFVISVLFALCANVVYGSAYNLSEWSQQNLVVFPMLLLSVLAAISLARGVQIFALAGLAVLWGLYFSELQQALH